MACKSSKKNSVRVDTCFFRAHKHPDVVRLKSYNPGRGTSPDASSRPTKQSRVESEEIDSLHDFIKSTLKTMEAQDKESVERDRQTIAITQAQLELAKRREEREAKLMEARDAREAEELELRKKVEKRLEEEQAGKEWDRAMDLAKHPLPRFRAAGEAMLEKLMAARTLDVN